MLGQAPMTEIPEIDPTVDAMTRRAKELMSSNWFSQNPMAQAQPKSALFPQMGMGNMAQGLGQLGQGQTAPVQPGAIASREDWLRYANDQAIRNQPLSPELVQALSFAPEMGLSVEVFSGGQDHKGHGHRRTGSTRHDGGHAGDLFLWQGDRRLDPSNPNDVPVLQEFVRRAKANGITGIGAGDGYMQPGSLHVGFGKEAIWGAEGKGANAAQWLSEAWYS